MSKFSGFPLKFLPNQDGLRRIDLGIKIKPPNSHKEPWFETWVLTSKTISLFIWSEKVIAKYPLERRVSSTEPCRFLLLAVQHGMVYCLISFPITHKLQIKLLYFSRKKYSYINSLQGEVKLYGVQNREGPGFRPLLFKHCLEPP